MDKKTGKRIKYNPEGKITLDESSGNYLITWIGMDGKPKKIVFEPSIKVDVIVEASVHYNEMRGKYQYFYKVRNLESSQQKLHAFILQKKATLEKIIFPDDGWRLAKMDNFKDGIWRGWFDWKHDRLGVPPGQDVDISFESSGLPWIVGCYAKGYGQPMQGVGEEMPHELETAIYRLSFEWPYGKTIGPAAAPESFDPEMFLQDLISMVDESFAQGWIKSQDVANYFKDTFQQIADAIDAKHHKEAIRRSQEILNKVEQEEGRTIISEAYALIKFNTDYLVRKLKK